MVTFPRDSFNETNFPSGLGAEKSALHLLGAGIGPLGAGLAPTEAVFI
jgi:hypothetical protein